MTMVLVYAHDPCLFDCTLEGWSLSVVVVVVFVSFRFVSNFVPRFVSFLFVSFCFILGLAVSMILDFRFRSSLCMVFFHEFVPGVSSPKGSRGGVLPRSPAGEGLLFFPRLHW